MALMYSILSTCVSPMSRIRYQDTYPTVPYAYLTPPVPEHSRTRSVSAQPHYDKV